MIARRIEPTVREALADTPVVLIVGPRQVGKSTLVLQLSDETRDYITLDDPFELAMAVDQPAAFLRAHPTPSTIDEVQRAPGLLLPMKQRVDQNRVAGAYLLTGSANVLTMPKVADSLAGRMQVIEMLPLSVGERIQAPDGLLDAIVERGFRPHTRRTPLPEVLQLLTQGGYPEAAQRTDPRRRAAWYGDYVRTILERDVRDLANIGRLHALPNLLQHLAMHPAAVMSASTSAQMFGIPYSSVRRYLTLLQRVYLTVELPAYSPPDGRQTTRSPKTYLLDSGLLAYLQNREALAVADSPEFARVLETFVLGELLKQRSWSPHRWQLSHLRTIRQHEVAFVLEGPNGDVYAIDVRPITDVRPQDTRGLDFLAELVGPRFRAGVLLTLGAEVRPIGEHRWAAPIDALWYTPPTSSVPAAGSAL
ncbi:MAG: ATP-binding protein [Fimbriimonadaceae bacterium]|nr:ATP-binding protein [Fimbriimonadaceae bacterium]